MKNKKRTMLKSGDITKNATHHFALEDELSLQSIPYATTINTFLNEKLLTEQHEND
ncbi:hypothetical protein [Bacillus dakarensis]|uniref:hypothetical protein n=1 Tax=Robertmurraya dakarensis TaxID=1926278 RepID=UPI0012B687BF|nr:hypothetical protein [Bacillus dakarensis]